MSSTSKYPLADSLKEDSGEGEPPSIGFTHSIPLDSNDTRDPSIGTAADSDTIPGGGGSDGRNPKNKSDPPVSGDEASSEERSTSHDGSESEVTASGSSAESSTGNERVQRTSDTEPSAGSGAHSDTESSGDSKVLRDEDIGETQTPDVGNNSQTEPTSVLDKINDADRKHDDPRAEYAHRKAQQRDPRDVVELGETISLVTKEADFQGRPPTVMGIKNKLVIFVTEAPRHVSKFDTIRAKVVDFGGKNNSAEAVFLGFEN